MLIYTESSLAEQTTPVVFALSDTIAVGAPKELVDILTSEHLRVLSSLLAVYLFHFKPPCVFCAHSTCSQVIGNASFPDFDLDAYDLGGELVWDAPKPDLCLGCCYIKGQMTSHSEKQTTETHSRPVKRHEQ